MWTVCRRGAEIVRLFETVKVERKTPAGEGGRSDPAQHNACAGMETNT
tara:strand:+ start:221 stop:364 length:144 start_codon:yes stop_codon:yes gene_type:complete